MKSHYSAQHHGIISSVVSISKPRRVSLENLWQRLPLILAFIIGFGIGSSYCIFHLDGTKIGVVLNDDAPPMNVSKSFHTSQHSVPKYLLHHPDKKIIINLGMPRTGTTGWIEMMKRLYPDENAELHHQLSDYATADLSELLLKGNRSTPLNVIYQQLTYPPAIARAMADHPAFLLAPIAKDFPNVYWIQVTRDVETHIDSTRWMLGEWCWDRCVCDKAPRCTRGNENMALLDRLYFNRFDALGHLCRNDGDASKIPRDLMRTWLQTHEKETQQHLQNHPRFLQLSLEEGNAINMKKMIHFLGLNESAFDSIDFESLPENANKRRGPGRGRERESEDAGSESQVTNRQNMWI